MKHFIILWPYKVGQMATFIHSYYLFPTVYFTLAKMEGYCSIDFSIRFLDYTMTIMFEL